MTRIAISALALLLAALIELSALPALLGDGLRPGLVLVLSSVWASLRGDEGLIWAFAGGMLLDFASAGPFGLLTAALMLGNVLALLFNRIPVPSRLFRATNWVAVVTVAFHVVLIAGLRMFGNVVDVSNAVFSRVLPMLLINPLSAIVAFAALSLTSDWLDRRTQYIR